MMTMDQLEYGISKYGTPLYIFDLDHISEEMAYIRKKAKDTAEICFAMKANPFLTEYMAGLTDRIEVCSMGEYEICKALGIEPQKLLISGVLKEEHELEKILEDCRSSCIYTAESMNQFCFFEQWSQKQNEHLKVYLRLTSGNQFGMDEKMAEDLIALHKVCPTVEICGLHFFSGTQKKSVKRIREELSRLDSFIQKIEKVYGFEIKDLEYGPGLKVSYFEGQEDNRHKDFEDLCSAVSEMKWKGTVILEMGRFLVGEGGYYLTRIRDLKTNNGVNYCIVDGGIHQIHYDGQIRGMYQPHIEIIPKRNAAEEEWIICGSLCTDNDMLAKARIRGVHAGDVLVFKRTGAYSVTEGMALFLSHSLPKVALFNKQGGWKLVRDALPTYLWNMENGGQKWKNC